MILDRPSSLLQVLWYY